MKIAIHDRKNSFSSRWISYCKEKSIRYKIVNCYDSDIIDQLKDCIALMWHFHHANSKDTIFAKQLLFSLQANESFRVFPDFFSSWHFDDKVGQKYLLETIEAPLAPTYIFYSKEMALKWAEKANYPIVFKLRKGAGSVNVKLITSYGEATSVIERSFRKGFIHDSNLPLIETWKKFRSGKESFSSVLGSVRRLFIQTEFSKTNGRERGYVYFQEFIQGNDHDIRVIVIGNKAFAIKRMIRDNDFRASGSGQILYEKENFDVGTIRLAFELAQKLRSQCVAFDFVYKDGKPLVVEISYGFTPEGYDACPGYWDESMAWHEGPFNPYGWMVEAVMK